MPVAKMNKAASELVLAPQQPTSQRPASLRPASQRPASQQAALQRAPAKPRAPASVVLGRAALAPRLAPKVAAPPHVLGSAPLGAPRGAPPGLPLHLVPHLGSVLRKRIRSTEVSVAQLLPSAPHDHTLTELILTLRRLNQHKQHERLQEALEQMLRTPQFADYQARKQRLMHRWLRPYRHMLAQPPEKMDKRQLLASLKRVAPIALNELHTRSELRIVASGPPWHEFNATSHVCLSSGRGDFWWRENIREAFHQLLSGLLRLCAMHMKARFLVFGWENDATRMLIGFPDDAFQGHPEDGSLHLKPLIENHPGDIHELGAEHWPGDPQRYWQTLRPLTLRFLQQASQVLGESSSKVSNADYAFCFDLWG